ncbi:hypothetical protein CPB85DRAFT_1435654 [Mucidula mucida]|nr:hypothetical protein CPB85DRAFT_1435654 [Mucidula mucida]
MSTERSSSPEADLDDVFSVMASSSPVQPDPKRRHRNGDEEDDEEDRFMSRKKLRTEQVTDVQVFLQVPATGTVNTIVVNTPPYTVSADLEKNLSAYSAGVLLSKGIASYKGKYATGHVLDVTFKLGFELPPRIQFNHSAMLKITAAAGDALTQKRSKFKKLLGVSLGTCDMKKKTLILLPKEQQQDIITLACAFVEGSNCVISVPLCCHIALMRMVYRKHSGPDFWDKLNARLASIRAQAKGSAPLLVKAFKFILEKDQANHGTPDPENPTDNLAAEVNAFQQGINDIITASSMNVASSTAAAPAVIAPVVPSVVSDPVAPIIDPIVPPIVTPIIAPV